MGKAAKAVSGIGDTITGLVKGPKIPKPAAIPPPTLMEDPELAAKSKKRKIASMKKRSGAASTVLDGVGTGTTFGAGR